MSSAPNYIPQYTASDYATWKGDWELWNGIAVSMSPSPNFQHQRIAAVLTSNINQALTSEAKCQHCVVVSELDWHVSSHTIVRPNVLIACGSPPEKHLQRAPAFIAEILSPSTKDKDLTAKRDLYEANGVCYYAIVDPKLKTLELLKLDEADIYQPTKIDEANMHLLLTDGCSISVDIGNLFQ